MPEVHSLETLFLNLKNIMQMTLNFSCVHHISTYFLKNYKVIYRDKVKNI